MVERYTASLLTPQTTRLVDINAFFGTYSGEVVAYNYDVISGEIFNVLTTRVGEETFEPRYGSLLPNRIFDPHDDITEQNMRMDIALALAEWVPQIQVDLANTLIENDPDARSWKIQIAFIVPNYGNDNIEIQFNY